MNIKYITRKIGKVAAYTLTAALAINGGRDITERVYEHFNPQKVEQYRMHFFYGGGDVNPIIALHDSKNRVMMEIGEGDFGTNSPKLWVDANLEKKINGKITSVVWNLKNNTVENK